MFPLLLLHFVCGAWTAPSLYSTSLLLMPKQSRRNHQSITTSGISTKWCFVLQQSISRSSLSILNDDNSQESQPPPQYHVTMEYCTGCRWMMRCAWMAQELLTTFQDELHGVTLIPSRASPGGVFRVVAIVASPTASGASSILLWDRKEQGGFPELKQLKQRLRDVVAPEQSLGHSDTPNRTSTQAPSSEPSSSLVIDANTVNTDCVDCHSPLGHFKTGAKGTLLPQPPLATTDGAVVINVPTGTAPVPNVAITYCTGCRWLLRAAWMGQELLTTFDTQIDSLTLIPSKPPQKGGTFSVTLNNEMVWDRSEQGRFPDVKELKQLIRDRIAPEKDLGHSDSTHQSNDKEPSNDLTMDDDEASKLRNLFGVQ